MPGAAQDWPAQFLATWTDFVSLCGPALLEPETAYLNQTRVPGFDHASYYNASGRDIGVHHYSLGYDRQVYYAVIVSPSTYNITCGAEQYDQDMAIPSGEVGAYLTALVEADPALSIDGGPAEWLEISGERPAWEALAFHSYVVDGAFAGHDEATILVHIWEHSFQISMQTVWERTE